MLFDLFLIAKLSIKIKYPNIFLLFIENLCCCSLKIAVCVLKITIISKNCRLKITEQSKNCGLKIPVCVRMYARMFARAYDCQDSTGTEHDRRKKGGLRQSRKLVYICMIADDEKKV